MNIVRSLAGMLDVRRAFIIGDLDRLMDEAVYGRPTSSGANVSEQSALCLPAVLACVDLISKTGSMLPGHVYRRVNDGTRDRERADRHYLYPLVHDMANPELPAMEWRRIALGHLLTWGNSYSWIEWNGSKEPKAIWIIPPDKIKVKRETITDPIQYFVLDKNGTWVEFPANDILHIRGLGFDGTKGYSPISLMRESIGLLSAAEKTAGAMSKNGYSSRLVLESPGVINPEQMQTLRDSLEAAYGGLQNKHKAIVVQGGMKAVPISISPHDAEFLSQWKYLDSKIYQMYGVPPHMVGDTEKSTSWGSGIEQQKDGFVTFTMQPWMELIETWMEVALLPPGQRQYFVEYDFKGLMRGDTAARSTWYEKMIKNGIYTPNDVLRKENENPYDGGDVYQRPLNTAFVDAEGKVISVTPPGGASGGANEQAI